METMFLYEMTTKYPSNLRVHLLDNGEFIFRGLVGNLMRYMDADVLARKVNVYISELSNLTANAYLQR